MFELAGSYLHLTQRARLWLLSLSTVSLTCFLGSHFHPSLLLIFSTLYSFLPPLVQTHRLVVKAEWVVKLTIEANPSSYSHWYLIMLLIGCSCCCDTPDLGWSRTPFVIKAILLIEGAYLSYMISRHCLARYSKYPDIVYTLNFSVIFIVYGL